MLIGRDLERIVRQFKRQRLDPEYIRHYLFETYQLAPATIDAIFAKVGLGDDVFTGNPMDSKSSSQASQKQAARANKFFQ